QAAEYAVGARRVRASRVSKGIDEAEGTAGPSAPSQRRRERRRRRPRRAPRLDGKAIVFLGDTNVLIYAADEEAAAHQKCRNLLDGWRRQASPWYLTWSIVYDMAEHGISVIYTRDRNFYRFRMLEVRDPLDCTPRSEEHN